MATNMVKMSFISNPPQYRNFRQGKEFAQPPPTRD